MNVIAGNTNFDGIPYGVIFLRCPPMASTWMAMWLI